MLQTCGVQKATVGSVNASMRFCFAHTFSDMADVLLGALAGVETLARGSAMKGLMSHMY